MPIVLRNTTSGRQHPVWKPSRLPRIPDRNLNVCFFTYPSVDDAEKGRRVGGCGFFAAVPVNGDDKPPYWIYAVSNKHVVKAAPVIRVNTVSDGTEAIDLAPTDWVWPDGADDFAVAPISAEQSYKYTTEPLNRLVDEAAIAEHSFGVGDEVFSIGRFVDSGGRGRNLPIVRFGNVAAMPEIPVSDAGTIRPSYLVEMRSRTGYSGSPIFIYIPQLLYEWVDRPRTDELKERIWPWVLGIQWGQFPIHDIDENGNVVKLSEMVGSGMTAVVPAWRIKKFLLEDPRLIAGRKAAQEALDAHIASADATSAPPTDAETDRANPQHKEAFTSLLSAAAQSKPQGD